MQRTGPIGVGLVAAVLALTQSTTALAQRADSSPVVVGGLVPNGGRTSVTDSWGSLEIELSNSGAIARTIRIAVFYSERPDVQFARDVWIPAQARITTWLAIGPAPSQSAAQAREFKYLLFDLTDGEARPLSPGGDERLRTKLVVYRKREPTTAVLVDPAPADARTLDPLAKVESPSAEAVVLARAFREARSLSEIITIQSDPFVPGSSSTLDGVDHIILASNRIVGDPAGQRAIRHWVQQGGTLWIMLDLVDPRTVAAILGEDLGFGVVGRTSLTSVRLILPWEGPETGASRTFEQPVTLVRVALDGSENVLFQVDGWPAAFTKTLGRGKALFTTLGGRAWHRPRESRDPRSSLASFPGAPVPLGQLGRLALEVQPDREQGGIQNEDLEPLLRSEIGYSVIGRPTVAVVLGGFAIAMVGIGWFVRRAARPAMGWLMPAAAIGAAAVLVALGTAHRKAVPPTAGTVAVAVANPQSRELSIDGLFAVYRPSPGPVHLAAQSGGNVELDTTGLEGQTRRRMLNDLDSWNWEGMSFPAGVRMGPFHGTIDSGDLSAVGHFGPNGLEGRLSRGPFAHLTEPLLLTAARDAVGLRVGEDGSISSAIADALPPGQYLSDAVLTERQQRRQEVYRRLFSRPLPRYFEGRAMVLAWTDWNSPPFTTEPGDRSTGEALIAIPLEFDRSPPGSRVTIPPGFIPCSAIVQGHHVRPSLESSRPAKMQLGFRLPRSVLPMTIERAILRARVRAPSRQFSVSGYAGEQSVPLRTVESPIDPVVVELKDASLLQLDPDGYLRLGIEVSARTGGDSEPGIIQLDDTWRIESLTLEVVGRVDDRK